MTPELDQRVTEVYEGVLGSPSEQRLLASRIHWMISHAEGAKVLDIGCEQGIGALLVARDGRRAVGIDRNPSAIEWARRRAAGEEASVQGRLAYEVAEAFELPFEDDSFDAVLIGGVLEEQVDPSIVLREALRVLSADGRLAVTSLYAELRAPPFGEPLYLSGLIGLLSDRVEVDDIALLDRYVALTGIAGAHSRTRPPADVWLRALDAAERALGRRLDSSLASAEELERLRADLEQASGRLAIVEGRERELQGEARAQSVRVARLEAELDTLRPLRAEAQLADRRRAQLDQRIADLEQERNGLRAAIGQTAERIARQEAEYAALEREAADAAAEAARLDEPARRPASRERRATLALEPRVVHLLGTSVPHALSSLALDRHGLLRAQRQSGIDSSAMTKLDFPWEQGVADSASFELIDGVAYYRLRDLERAGDELEAAMRVGDELLGILDPQILHAASVEAAPLAVALARRHSLRCVIELATELPCAQALDPAWLAATDTVIALSERQRAAAIGAGAPEDRVQVIPAFVDAPPFVSPPPTSSAGREGPVVGVVAYQPDSPAIGALRELLAGAERSIRGLLISVTGAETGRVGDGERLERIEASGYDIDSWMAQMDIVIAATPHEALDAMAAARPVVGVGAATGFAAGIEELPELLADPPLRVHRGAAGRAAIEEHNTDAALKAYDRLYALGGES